MQEHGTFYGDVDLAGECIRNKNNKSNTDKALHTPWKGLQVYVYVPCK